MANRYKLEGESKPISFGGIGSFISKLIIVVVGIFIALELSNYKTEQKEKLLVNDYLTELKDAAESHFETLASTQNDRDSQIESLQIILQSTNRQVSTDTLYRALEQLFITSSPSPVSLLNTISSAELQLIKNREIKHQIQEYKKYLSLYTRAVQSDKQLVEQIIEPYFIDKQLLSWLQPIRKMPTSQASQRQLDQAMRNLSRDRSFLDMVYLRINKLKDIDNMEAPIAQNVSRTIQLIDAELQSF